MENRIIYVYIISAIVFWGSAPAIIKLFLTNLDVFQITFFMFLLATICLFFLIFIRGKYKQFFLKDIKEYLYYALMGFIGIFLYFQFLFIGILHSSVQEAYVINYTWPLWMVIFSIILLKDHIKIRNILSILIGFIGLLVIITNGDLIGFTSEKILGYISALLSALFYGLFSALGKKYTKDITISIFYYFLFSSLYSCIFLMLFSSVPTMTFQESTAILWLGIFSCAFGFLFWFKSLQFCNTSELVNYMFITPFVSLSFVYLLIIEQVQWSSLVGLCIIIIAIFIDRIDFIKLSTS